MNTPRISVVFFLIESIQLCSGTSVHLQFDANIQCEHTYEAKTYFIHIKTPSFPMYSYWLMSVKNIKIKIYRVSNKCLFKTELAALCTFVSTCKYGEDHAAGIKQKQKDK